MLKEIIKKQKKITRNKFITDMLNENKLSCAQDILDNVGNVQVKRVKKDLGLLERTENDKIILVEDNRQVLLG